MQFYCPKAMFDLKSHIFITLSLQLEKVEVEFCTFVV
jgi:hypothetical protein